MMTAKYHVSVAVQELCQFFSSQLIYEDFTVSSYTGSRHVIKISGTISHYLILEKSYAGHRSDSIISRINKGSVRTKFITNCIKIS